jgi:hypothetical protein
MLSKLLHPSSWGRFPLSRIFPAYIRHTFAEKHTWQPDRPALPQPSFRRFSTTAVLCGTAGRERWRIWASPVPTPCRATPPKPSLSCQNSRFKAHSVRLNAVEKRVYDTLKVCSLSAVERRRDHASRFCLHFRFAFFARHFSQRV